MVSLKFFSAPEISDSGNAKSHKKDIPMRISPFLSPLSGMSSALSAFLPTGTQMQGKVGKGVLCFCPKRRGGQLGFQLPRVSEGVRRWRNLLKFSVRFT